MKATANFGKTAVAYFDGACQAHIGGGGFALWDDKGVLRTAQYRYYGKAQATNNESECQALLDTLSFALKHPELLGNKKLLLRGDSALIINFMTRKNTPKKKSLVRKVL